MDAIKGKHVLITGAGRGLGAALAIIMADHGAHVTLAGRNAEQLDAVATAIAQRTHKRPNTCLLDLSDIKAVSNLTPSWQQPLDILINNAATWLSGALDDHDDETIARTITANVTGTLLLTRGLLPRLKTSSAADIVNIVSISGLPNVPLQGASVAFVASKHGQAGMTDALRQELRVSNIRITAVYPPMIEDISPLQAEWNVARDNTSWITNKDVVQSVLSSLQRERHVSFMQILLETQTAHVHGHQLK
jgi:short-subunit dehydrogenase